MSPTKTAEPVKMLFGGWLRRAQGTMYWMSIGDRDPLTGRGNSWGCPAKGIIQFSVMGWHVMQPFVNILWPFFDHLLLLLLALLMGQYYFACWRLSSSSSVIVCNAAGVRAGRPTVGRVGGRAADTTWRASTVTSC